MGGRPLTFAWIVRRNPRSCHMTHYQSADDLTVGCIIVQRRHLSEASASGRHNSSSQNGLIKLREVLDSTREMENKRLIKNLSCHRQRDCGCGLCRCQDATRSGNVLDSCRVALDATSVCSLLQKTTLTAAHVAKLLYPCTL